MGPNAKSLAYGWRSTTLVIIAFNIIIYSESGWARVRLYGKYEYIERESSNLYDVYTQ